MIRIMGVFRSYRFAGIAVGKPRSDDARAAG